MDDFETLKKVIEGELNINEIDSQTKQRLVIICKQRLRQVEKKIEETNEKIMELEGIIKKNT